MNGKMYYYAENEALHHHRLALMLRRYFGSEAEDFLANLGQPSWFYG
jgi:hypothetical protein